MEVSTDDIVVTGCRVRNTSSSEDDSYDELWVDSTLEQTHDRYVLVIENNPFIKKAKAANIANLVGSILAGLQIRAFSATSLNDMSYETGDVVTVYDFRGNFYYTWITNLTFTTNNSEQFSCGALSPKQRAETRYPAAITSAEAQMMISDYDNAVKAMDELAQNAIGYNEYVYVSGSNRIMYRFDAIADMPASGTADPKFPNSNNVFKITGDGTFVARRSHGDIAADGTCTYSNGYDANSGTAILDLIYAIGLNADWINAGTISAGRIYGGTLTLGGAGNVYGSLEIKNASGTVIGTWNKDGIDATTGSFSGTIKGTDGVGTAELTSGNLLVNRSGGYGAGIYLYKTGTAYYSAFGAQICAAKDSEDAGGYIDCTTKELIRAGYNVSDERRKTDIKDIDSDFSEKLILGIKPKEFRFKDIPNELQFGVIAQDVKEILDECGIEDENRLFYTVNEGGTYGVEYKQFIAPMIKVIQNQQEQIDLLKQEVAELKARVE